MRRHAAFERRLLAVLFHHLADHAVDRAEGDIVPVDFGSFVAERAFGEKLEKQIVHRPVVRELRLIEAGRYLLVEVQSVELVLRAYLWQEKITLLRERRVA